ncbi:MAG: tetratricopeptide repeat protein [Bacteroidota bacterium]
MKKSVQRNRRTNSPVIPQTSTGKRKGERRWATWAIAASLLIITWFLYKPSLDNKFTNWDDNVYVLENAQVKEPGMKNAGYFFTNASASNYHPLTMLSLSLDYKFAGKKAASAGEPVQPDALPFHITSLFFHLLNVLLVFIFVYLLSRKRLIVATVTALLFAIHPMHVESVAWISERKDVLYTFFFLSGLVVYLKYLEKQRWILLVASGLLFVLSLFSKPSAVVFPLVLIAIDYFYGRKFTAAMLLEKVPFFILSAVFGIITVLIQGHLAEVGIKVFTVVQRIMFASYGLVMYQYRLIVPSGISAFYPYPSVTSSGNLPPFFYLAPGIVIVIAAIVAFSARYTKVLGFGYLFYFISTILVIQFVPVGNAIMADRYSYLSAIGLFFILGWYVDQAFITRNRMFHSLRWILTGFLCIYFIFLGKTAYEQTKVWENSETLWTDVISKYPQAFVALKHRGNYYSSLNRFDKAIGDYEAFTRIRQDDAGIYNNLGNAYRLHGENDKALIAYSKSITIDSLDPKTWLNRAVIYSIGKQYNTAMRDFNKALTLKAGSMEIYISRSVMYKEMGRYREAVDDYSRVISENPRNENYFMDRGFCYFQLKQIPEALSDFERCMVLNPANGHACYNISAAYNELKNYKKAYQFAIKARSLDYPVDNNLLETLKKKGG